MFCRFLVDNGANVVAVNSEGEIAVDLAEEDDMREYLEDEIRKQGNDTYESISMIKKCFIFIFLFILKQMNP